MHSDGKTHKVIHLPISIKLLLAFLVVCSCLTAISGFIYYKHAEKVVMDSIKNQTSLVCKHVVHEFYTLYADPIERELRIIEASPQLNSYLMSSQEEMLLHRADVERLFLSIIKGYSIHLSTSFLDASGQEKIVIQGNKRKRRYQSLSDLQQADVTGQLTHKLFVELSSDTDKTLAYTPPFYDAQNRPGLLVGIAKQEPEAGGFGGVIIQHCSLGEFIDKVAQDTVLNTPVVWIRSGDGSDFMVPPQNAIRSNPWIPSTNDTDVFQSYIELGECRLFAEENPLLTVACSIPWEIIAKELAPVIWSVTIVFSSLLGVSVIGSFLISRSISKPIKSLTAAVQQVSGRNLTVTIPRWLEHSRDEVGILANAFMKMTRELRASTTSIDDLNMANSQLKASQHRLQEVNEELEANEHKRHENMDRLMRFNRLAAQRELKMRELKQEINGLLSELGRDRKFKDTSEIVETYSAWYDNGE
jgi:HAMP domain-containing protein